MTVTACSTVLGEVGVLRACADSLNETAATSSTAGGINALSWPDALRALDGLRLAVETLAQIDAALVRHLFVTADHGDLEVEGIGRVNISRSPERKRWDDRRVVAGLIDHHMEELGGEPPSDPWDIAEWILEAAGIGYWRVGALRGVGLDPDHYCERQTGKPRVTITH